MPTCQLSQQKLSQRSILVRQCGKKYRDRSPREKPNAEYKCLFYFEFCLKFNRIYILQVAYHRTRFTRKRISHATSRAGRKIRILLRENDESKREYNRSKKRLERTIRIDQNYPYKYQYCPNLVVSTYILHQSQKLQMS